MRAVNLLPRDALAADRNQSTLLPIISAIGALLVPVIAGALVFTGYSSTKSLVSTRSTELANLEAAMPATIPVKVATAAPELSIINASISARESALSTALSAEMPWDTTLNDIARVIPSGVWLTSLSAQSPVNPATAAAATAAAAAAAASAAAATTTDGTTTTPAATPPPSTTPAASSAPFSIGGTALTEQDLAELISRLELLPSLANVTLTSASTSQLQGKNVVGFNITANVQPPAPSTTTGAQP
jgi:Tfp pilus assembly protein PilN